MDGHSLSRLMHKRGINIRYLGTIATLAGSEGRKLQAVKILAEQESQNPSYAIIDVRDDGKV